MSREVFSKEIIASVSRTSKGLNESVDALDKISTSGDIHALYDASHMALNGLSNMFAFVEFNMRLINEIYLVLDNLPNAEEIRNAVETIKKDHEFTKWERRVREDEVKEKEK
jgi:hypothetical protein